MSENDDKGEDDRELDRELIRHYWRADPWNNFNYVMGQIRDTIDLIRLLFWFGRLVWTIFSSIASGH